MPAVANQAQSDSTSTADGTQPLPPQPRHIPTEKSAEDLGGESQERTKLIIDALAKLVFNEGATNQSVEDLKKEKNERKNDRIIAALSELFSTGTTTGAFFAGFTLNIVVSTDANEHPSVRMYAAICSLLFVILVLLCSAGSVVLAYYSEDITQVMNGNEELARELGWTSAHIWAIFGLLPTFLFTILASGIIFFFLVMNAYENAVALAGLVAIGVGMFLGGIGWLGVLYTYFKGEFLAIIAYFEGKLEGFVDYWKNWRGEEGRSVYAYP